MTDKAKIEELEVAMRRPDFWENKARAQEVIKELSRLKAELAGGDKSGYDSYNAVITVFAGAGGDDAEDFARLLFAMYVKYAERQGFSIFVVHQNQNDHGGFRNITFVVQGRGAYGILKGESGVHRLVRLSPFDAKKLRHTSFALVEVIPDFPRDAEIKIDSRDLKIEFFRSSGPGGQNVNKRETAVRIIHLPTGLVAHSEAERSQERNRERALAILQGKLYKLEEERRAAQERGMKISKTTEIAWGNQIRSYILHPYKLVKDHRTGVESHDAEEVLNGEIDIFLKAQS